MDSLYSSSVEIIDTIMAKILITGASGLLGRALMTSFYEYQTTGTAFKRARRPLVRLNLCDSALTRRFIVDLQPEIVIHCAAERRPDVSENDPDNTEKLNVGVTQELARIVHSIGASMLFLSTDYVFDGTRPPYAPDDRTNPLNFYGKTKLLAEKTVLEVIPDSAVLRVGLLYGRVEFPEESSVTALLQDVRSQQTRYIDHWGRRYPTFVDDVAVVCRQLIQSRLQKGPFSGIWHWCGNEGMTKYEMAKRIAELLSVPTDHLKPDTNPPKAMPRPKDCRLDFSRLESLGIGQRTPFTAAMRKVLGALGERQT